MRFFAQQVRKTLFTGSLIKWIEFISNEELLSQSGSNLSDYHMALTHWSTIPHGHDRTLETVRASSVLRLTARVHVGDLTFTDWRRPPNTCLHKLSRDCDLCPSDAMELTGRWSIPPHPLGRATTSTTLLVVVGQDSNRLLKMSAYLFDIS